MTSPLRRKRPTTAPARNPTPARTACRGGVPQPLLAGLGLLLASGLAAAQAPTPVTLNPIPDAPPPIKTLPHKIKPHEPFAGQREPVQQAQHLGTMPNDASTGEYQYLVEPPGPDKLFTRDSEADFQV